MPRLEHRPLLPPEIASLFSGCPPEWQPLVIDDRTHVHSIAFPNDSGENGSSSASSDDDDSGNAKRETAPKALVAPGPADVPFSTFYAGHAFLCVSSSSSATGNDTALKANVIRMHALLRPPPDPNSSASSATGGQVPAALFGAGYSDEDGRNRVQAQTVALLQADPRKRLAFVRDHLLLLTRAWMPTIQHQQHQQQHHYDDDDCCTALPSASFEIMMLAALQDKAGDGDSVPAPEAFGPSVFTTVPRHLSAADASALFDRPDLLDRLLFSYSLLLPAFGWRLHSFTDGTVDRAADWKAKYAALQDADEGSAAQQPNMTTRILCWCVTGILRSLVDLRMRRIATKLVHFVWEELCAKRLLALRPVWEHVWVPMVLVQGCCRQAAPPPGEEDVAKESKTAQQQQQRWIFDEEQKALWLARLNKEPSSSDDD